MEANAITYEVSELKTSYLLIPKLARKWFEIEKLVRVGPDDLGGIGVSGADLTAFHQATGHCHKRSSSRGGTWVKLSVGIHLC